MKNAMKMAAMAAVLMFSANVNAQEEYGAEKGAFSTELQFNPFSNNFETFKIDGLSFRYFFSENSALRLNLNVGVNNISEGKTLTAPERSDYSDNAYYQMAKEAYENGKDYSNKINNTNFGLNLGYEYHFAKYGRADLYAGAQIGFNTESWSQTIKTPTPYNTKEDGSSTWVTLTEEYKGAANTNDDDKLDEISSFIFKAGVFTGIDFYLTKSLYVGAELGINFATASANNIDYSKEYLNASNKVEKREKTYETSYSVSSLKFNVVPALRLGWKF